MTTDLRNSNLIDLEIKVKEISLLFAEGDGQQTRQIKIAQ